MRLALSFDGAVAISAAERIHAMTVQKRWVRCSGGRISWFDET